MHVHYRPFTEYFLHNLVTANLSKKIYTKTFVKVIQYNKCTVKLHKLSRLYLSQTGQLDVVVPPDILDDENGRSAEAAPEGGSVRLRCDATGVPQPSVVWRREDGRDIVLRDSSRERGQGTHQLIPYCACIITRVIVNTNLVYL